MKKAIIMNKQKKLLPIVLALVLSGCVSIPNLKEVKKVSNGDIKIENIYKLSQSTPLEVDSQQWWKKINDDQLNNLMDKVLEHNDDMNIALLNIEKTKINVDLANTAQIPSVSLDGSVQKQKFSQAGLTPPPYAGSNINFSQVAISSSYEFDLFGKYDGMIKEQSSRLKAIELKRDYLVLTLSNQVVKQYGYWQYLKFEQLNLNEQLDLAQKNLELQKKKLELGQSIIQNLLTQENNIKSIQILLIQNKQNIKQTENNLQVLSGSFNPNELIIKKDILNFNLPKIDSVQADTVSKRPDVAYYLAMIDSQQYHLNTLKADFYPSISISGDIGLQKVGLSNLLNANNWFGAIGPAIHLPILDAGKIKGNYKVAGVDANIFIEQYNQAVLKSFYDINTQLYNYKNAYTILNEQKEIFKNQEIDFLLNKKQLELGNISQLNFNNFQDKNLKQNIQDVTNQFTYFNAQMDLVNSLGGVVKIEK